jgi:hypothetical protein
MRNDSKKPQVPPADHLIVRADNRYYAEVSTNTLVTHRNAIEQLIDLAFDTLGALHLEVRVLEEKPSHKPCGC